MQEEHICQYYTLLVFINEIQPHGNTRGKSKEITKVSRTDPLGVIYF